MADNITQKDKQSGYMYMLKVFCELIYTQQLIRHFVKTTIQRT